MVFRFEKKDILAVYRMNFAFLGIFELPGCKAGEIVGTFFSFTQHLIWYDEFRFCSTPFWRANMIFYPMDLSIFFISTSSGESTVPELSFSQALLCRYTLIVYSFLYLETLFCNRNSSSEFSILTYNSYAIMGTKWIFNSLLNMGIIVPDSINPETVLISS